MARLFYCAKSNCGEATILFIFSVFIFLGLITISTLLIKKHITIQIELLNLKICHSKIEKHHLDYVRSIEAGNKIIILSHLGKAYMPLAITSRSINKIVRYAQEYKYHHYIYKLLRTPRCNQISKTDYMSPYPFIRRNGYFKRENSGIVKKKKSTYKRNLCFNSIKVNIKNTYRINLTGTSTKWTARDMAYCL